MACLAIVIENQRASGFFPGPHDFAERLLPNPTVCAIQGKRITKRCANVDQNHGFESKMSGFAGSPVAGLNFTGQAQRCQVETPAPKPAFFVHYDGKRNYFLCIMLIRRICLELMLIRRIRLELMLIRRIQDCRTPRGKGRTSIPPQSFPSRRRPGSSAMCFETGCRRPRQPLSPEPVSAGQRKA